MSQVSINDSVYVVVHVILNYQSEIAFGLTSIKEISDSFSCFNILIPILLGIVSSDGVSQHTNSIILQKVTQ